jgi:hypothetical protein
VIGAIALQALLASHLGLALGNRIGERWREGAERLAGIALAAVALPQLCRMIGAMKCWFTELVPV